jgi:hypothetical protein
MHTRKFNIGNPANVYVIWIHPLGVDLWAQSSPLIQ